MGGCRGLLSACRVLRVFDAGELRGRWLTADRRCGELGRGAFAELANAMALLMERTRNENA